MNRIINTVKENGYLILILLVAAFLRLYRLDFQSLWVDEIFTLNMSDPSMPSAQFYFEMELREGFPYLYFYLLKGFYFFLGYSEWTARFFSALSGIASVYAIYLLGKELFYKNIGLIAAVLLCVNEYNIFISQDARPYGFYLFAIILSFWALIRFIKFPSLKTALYYGLFTGFALNTNFFTFVNILSQVIIILFFIAIQAKEERIKILKFSIISGILALLLFVPNYKMLVKLLNFKSFWVPAPGPTSVTDLITNFLGNFEFTKFIFLILFIYYIFKVFNYEKSTDIKKIHEDKLQLSFVVLFGWTFVFFVFIVVKSYMDISLMLARYFVSATAAITMILAIAIGLIRNTIARKFVLTAVVILSLINLFVVKEYYSKVSKSQFREISAEIVEKNTNSDIVVSSWGWLFNFYLKESTGRNTIESPLNEYVKDMASGKVSNNSFWYADANERNYLLPLELENYLNEHFILKETIEKYDTWAKHYVSKNGDSPFLNMNLFQDAQFDGSGAMIFVSNSTYTYPKMTLAKGNYSIIMRGKSLPAEPINNENAHFNIIINGEVVGSGFLDNKENNSGLVVNYTSEVNQMIVLKIEYDNDVNINGNDRNAIVNSVQINKQK